MKHGFGIIGAGAIAEVHARAIKTLEDSELVGIYDTHHGRTLSFSREFSCHAFSSPGDLINSKTIDIVCICTPSGMHLEPALQTIRAGKHCIIEKPLEITLERCDRIIEAGIKQNVMVSGIFPMRFADVNVELKKSVFEGRFGKFIFGDVFIKWHRSPEYYNDVRWRAILSKCGGGAIMNQGIHSIDLLQWYMGKVDSVCAFTGLIEHRNIEVEDTGAALLRFANGALGVIEASTAVNPGFFRRIELLGSQGSVIVEEENILTWKFDEERDEDKEIRAKYSGDYSSGGGVSDPKAISDTGHIRQLKDFVGAVDSGRSPAVDAIEARKAVELVLAIYESAEKKRIINL